MPEFNPRANVPLSPYEDHFCVEVNEDGCDAGLLGDDFIFDHYECWWCCHEWPCPTDEAKRRES